MTFGKCRADKGKTVAEVLAVDPNDFEHLTSWKSEVPEPHPDLRDGPDKASLLSGLSERRPSLQRARAEKILAQASDTLARRGATRGRCVGCRRVRRIRQTEAGEARFCAQGPRRAQETELHSLRRSSPKEGCSANTSVPGSSSACTMRLSSCWTA